MITRLIKVSFFLLIALTAIGQPLEFEFSTSSMPAPGGVYEVDVKVANFEELLAAQVGIYWDSTVMRIDTLPFVTGDLPDFNRQALSLPEDNQTVVRGKLKLSWSSLSLIPQSLADGTLLFTMRFDVIGMPCDTTSLTLGDPQPPFLRIEVIHNEKDEIGAIANDFPIMIPGTGCGDVNPPVNCMPGDLELVFQDASGSTGDNICIPMIVNNFDDVSTFQMSAGWDPSIMTYTGVQNFILPGSSPASFNVNEANGTVTYVWFDNSTVMPQTFADGTALFELCFDIIGNSGTTTTIVAQSMPTIIQASNSSGDILDTCPVAGTVTVGGMPPVGEFTLISQSVTASQSTVCVDITTNNFDDIVTAQFAVQWDNSVLSYSSLTNLNQTLPLFESLFNQVGDVLRFSWNNPDPIDLPDGTVLFTICYDVVGPCDSTTPISFIGDPVPIEIAASGPNGDAVIPFQLVEGTVNVTLGCPTGSVVITPSVTNVACNGDSNGSISLALSGGTAPYTCMWATLGTTTDNNGVCVQNNLNAGTYSVTVTDSAGNSATSAPTVTEPQAITINGNTTPASGTTGGTINYVISGGTPPYMEQFNPPVPNLNNVPAGTYTLLVTDANQCQQPRVFTVTGATNPVVVQIDGVTDSSCNSNGRICVTCTGGTGVYGNPIAFSNSISLTYDPNQRCFINVPGGTYTIRCTDSNGAIGERTVNVNTVAPSPLSCQVTNVVPAICDVFGGSFDVTCTGGCPGYAITVSLNGGPKMTYNPISSYAAGDYTVCIRDASGGEQVINFNLPEVSNGPIEVSAVVDSDAMCNSNGSVTTMISGGCSLTCSLLNNTTGVTTACDIGLQVLSLPAGNYTLTAQDTQGDSESTAFTVNSTSPDLMVAVNSISDAPCAGMNGSVSLNVTGGCGNTTCTISIGGVGPDQECDLVNGAISAPAGTHTITIIDNDTGVPVSLPVTIPVSPDAVRPFVVDVTNTSIDISVSGGLSPYIYTWTFPDGITTATTDDLTGLTMAGIYSLSVVDDIGCSAGLEVMWPINPDNLTLLVDSNTLASDCGSGTDCNGEITGTVLNGDAPYNITISDQEGNSTTFQIAQMGPFILPNVCGGSYTVSVVDGAGTMEEFGSPVDVMSPDPLIIEEDDVMCSNFGEMNGSVSVFVDGGNGGYEYDWTPTLPNAGPSNDNLSPGTYTLNVTDVNGCTSSISLVVEDCDGQENCGEGLLVMTPNGDGRNDNLIITCAETQDNTLAIYDRYGRNVFSVTNYRNGWNGVDLDGEPLREGAYHWVYIVNGQITKGTITLLRD